MPPVAVGLGHHQRPVTPRAVGDEDLAAVDYEMAPVASRDRGDPGHVGAGVGFRDRQRRYLVALDRRYQPPSLLLLGAELEHGRRGHLRLDGDRHAQTPAARLGHLLGQDDRREVVTALAPVLGWVAQSEEAKLAEPLEDRPWES